MPSRVLETVLTGRNLLSPVLTGAATDVEAYDAKVSAANARAGESATASARTQETAAAKVTAANVRSAESSSAASSKVVAANARAAESSRAFADVTESSAVRSTTAFANLATKGIPLAAAAVAVVTGKMAADFQSNVVRLETTAGEAHKNLAMVSQGMLDLAPAVGISANELAKGMYTVESASFHGRDALLVEKAAAQGAAQEHADLAHVTDAVTTSLHDYHLGAGDAAKVTSELIAAVSHGKTTFDELTGAMHSIEPVAAGAGMTIAQTAGALAAMTASGMHADQAAQNLAHTIGSFENATKPMRDELFQIGLDATDLQTHLGERGIAGTLQIVSDAIVHKMGPAGQVALTALQTNKTAVQGLSTMIGAMPPQLADLATGLLAGTTGQKDFRQAALDLGGTAGALADQFLAAYKSNDGFSSSLKSGGPQVQTYIGALAKAVGTADGLRTALMLTGENADSTNKSIAAVGKASADSKGNIEGWAAVEATAAQQAKEAGAGIGKLAIEMGQHLLPAATNTLGVINRDVIPGLEHMGSGIGAAVDWFKSLPGPVKEAVLALAALKIVTGTEMFAGLVASGRVLAVGFANDMGNMVASARAGSGAMTAAFAEAKAAQQALVAEQFGASAVSRATGDIAGLGAAAGVAARGGLSAMRSAAGGVVGMLGGPWVLATAGAVVGVIALMNAIKRHDEEVKKDTDAVQKWQEAVDLGGSGQSAIAATKHLDALREKLAAVTTQMEKNTAAAQQAPSRFAGAAAAVSGLGQEQSDLQSELDKGTAAWKKQLAAMTPVQEATARVQIAERDLQMDRKNYGDSSQAVINDEIRLNAARNSLTGETERANSAEKTRIQRLQDSANATLGLVDANRQAQEASLELTQQVSDYNQQIADGTLKGDALKSATLGIIDSAERAAKAAGDAAAQQAKQNGATDTASASQSAFMRSLQDFDSTLTGPAKKAMDDYIAQLGGQQSQAQLTAGAIEGLGVTVTDLPNEHMITIDAPTEDQKKRLQDLGYVTATLPDGHIVVTADTSPAMGEIVGLLNYARQQSITYRATLPDLNGSASGSGRPGLATGGWVRGPGTGTSDEVPIMGSNGEFMVKASAAAQNAGLLEDINSGRVRGYATGGWVGVPPGGAYLGTAAVPVHVQDAGYMAGVKALAQQLSAPPASAGGNAANRALGQQIAAAMGLGGQFAAIDYVFSHESGWNNLAQNPTSSAYGIPQFLDSTWRLYGGKTSDPRAQILDGLEYMRDRYGSPNGAQAFWQSHHWYKGGGYTGDGDPNDPAGIVHGREFVTDAATTAKHRPLLEAMHAGKLSAMGPVGYNAAGTGFTPASMPGYGTPAGGRTAVTVTPQVTVQARVFVGSREITDIVRVEATAIVDGEMGAIADKMHYAGGGG